jgi:hypothetical protein
MRRTRRSNKKTREHYETKYLCLYQSRDLHGKVGTQREKNLQLPIPLIVPHLRAMYTCLVPWSSWNNSPRGRYSRDSETFNIVQSATHHIFSTVQSPVNRARIAKTDSSARTTYAVLTEVSSVPILEYRPCFRPSLCRELWLRTTCRRRSEGRSLLLQSGVSRLHALHLLWHRGECEQFRRLQ